MEVKNLINNTLATAKRWPWPLNRGGRWIEVSNTAVYWQINRDFGKWPLNRWPLNRGRTVVELISPVRSEWCEVIWNIELKRWHCKLKINKINVSHNYSFSGIIYHNCRVLICASITCHTKALCHLLTCTCISNQPPRQISLNNLTYTT